MTELPASENKIVALLEAAEKGSAPLWEKKVNTISHCKHAYSQRHWESEPSARQCQIVELVTTASSDNEYQIVIVASSNR